LELAGVEIGYIVNRLNSTLSGYYISNIYSASESSILLKLHHPRLAERRLVIQPGVTLWLTSFDPRWQTLTPWVKDLRRFLLRSRFKSAEQPDGERIVILSFVGGDSTLRLISEFFSKGNIVLTDNEGKILLAMHEVTFRHRQIRRGITYQLPPSRAGNPLTLGNDWIMQYASSSEEVGRVLGRSVALPSRYLTEIMARVKVSPDTKMSMLSREQLEALHDQVRKLAEAVVKGDHTPVNYVVGGKVELVLPQRFLSLPPEAQVETASFEEELDKLLTSRLLRELLARELEPIKREIEKLNHTLEEQRRIIDSLTSRGQRLRELAYTVAASPESELPSRLAALGFQFSPVEGGLDVKVEGGNVILDLSGPKMRLSSELFDQAKEVERRLEASRRAYSSLEEELRHQTIKLEQQRVRSSVARPSVAKDRSWFERYRWFRTSSGHLAVGGRDASSNSSLIRKHMEDDDLVFHADIYGSPFFILKSGRDAPEPALIETASAVVSFSSAWKAGFSAGDAYWVTPRQIRMQAPSGMYLPKGSFVVEGKKNFIRNVRVGVAIGVARFNGEWHLVCGPKESVAKSAQCYVTINPDRVKPTDTAKSVKSALLNCSEASARSAVKMFPIDRFLAIMPAGGGVIVSRHNC